MRHRRQTDVGLSYRAVMKTLGSRTAASCFLAVQMAKSSSRIRPFLVTSRPFGAATQQGASCWTHQITRTPISGSFASKDAKSPQNNSIKRGSVATSRPIFQPHTAKRRMSRARALKSSSGFQHQSFGCTLFTKTLLLSLSQMSQNPLLRSSACCHTMRPNHALEPTAQPSVCLVFSGYERHW